MTRSVNFFAEPVASTGSIGGRGLRRLLGKPGIAPFELLMREALQNSWDARSKTNSRLIMTVGLRKLLSSQRAFLAKELAPPARARGGNSKGLKKINTALRKGMNVLEIRDSGTRGMGGPVDPTVRRSSKQRGDFINFVFDVGASKSSPGVDHRVQGGTHGFGRSTLFSVSQIHCVVVYTRWKTGQKVQSRLIVLGWQEEYDEGLIRYTGRLFWGKKMGTKILPLTGPGADRFAKNLGLKKMEGTGTSLLVLAPNLRSPASDEELKTPEDLARQDALETLKWYGWPRILQNKLEISLQWEGYATRKITKKDVTSDPRLNKFSTLFTLLQQSVDENPPDLVTLKHTDTRRRDGEQITILGRLALWSGPHLAGSPRAPDWAVPGHRYLCHVALLRGTRLVVKYMDFPWYSSEERE